jgi:hypothetical protein
VSALLTGLGACILLLVAGDAYGTILHARGRSGLLAQPLCRALWAGCRSLAFRLPAPVRHRFLDGVGPLILPAILGMYLFLLGCGFALIYAPRMSREFSGGATAREIALGRALYFSGVTLTTVGYGDVVPRTPAMRAVAVAESSSGLVLISLGVSYLVSVYRALERKRAVAVAFHHHADSDPDVGSFLSHHLASGTTDSLFAALRSGARDLQELMEAHLEHPVLHYFHPLAVFKSMPRVLYLSLELGASVRGCLDPERYPALHASPDLRSLESSAAHALASFGQGLRPRDGGGPPDTVEGPDGGTAAWERAARRLEEAGLEAGPASAERVAAYVAHRVRWERPLHAYARHLGYEWREIAPPSTPKAG